MVRDNTSSVKAQPFPPTPQSNRTGIFCLYNNTRFFRGSIYNFLPQNLPFTLCPNIVYWSFRVRDGFPISRIESFGCTYGLNNVSEVVNKSGVPSVRILLNTGGYVESRTTVSCPFKEEMLQPCLASSTTLWSSLNPASSRISSSRIS
ncbi:hypothetical protein MRX96_051594 [Rhipicephalus microplus]